MQARLGPDSRSERGVPQRRGAALSTAFLAAFLGAGPPGHGPAQAQPAAAGGTGVAVPPAAASPAPPAAPGGPAIVATLGDPAFDAARALLARALGHEPGLPGSAVGDRLLVLDGGLAAILAQRHWQPPRQDGAAGASTMERVRTMVELARALRLPTAVGVLQASFGTPAENGLVEPGRAVAAAHAALAKQPGSRALAAALDERQRELDAALAALPAFRKSGRDWALADLDVDRNGSVDAADLAAVDGRRRELAARMPGPAVAVAAPAHGTGKASQAE
jgi:hypothetical protein